MSVSIVIASWNDFDYLKTCLKSLKSDPHDKEIIVVDDALSDEVEDLCSDVRFFRTKGNCGPATAWNIGLDVATNNLAIVLNSDTEVYDGFCRDYLYHYNLIGDCVLGPTGNIVGQNLRIRCIDDYWKTHDFHRIQVDHIGGFCMLFDKSIGRFDEGYRLYYEDADWCVQAWKKNVPVYFLNPQLLPVKHIGGASTAKLSTAKYHMNESRRRFVSKWRHYYRTKEVRSIILEEQTWQ